MDAPATIQSHGTEYDLKKMTNSTVVIISTEDADTLDFIRQQEASVARENPDFQLHSVLRDEIKHSELPMTGVPCRVKMTKKSSAYSAQNPGEGAAPNLEALGCNHLLVAQCRAQPWCFNNMCGITIYCNVVRGLGVLASPWVVSAAGESAAAGVVEWL